MSTPRFELSVTQLLATALAAVTATIASAYLGVSGTVVGAAIASVVSVVGTAVYGHSIRRTHSRIRATPGRLPRVALGSVAMFVAVLAVVTGVELVAGRPISDLVHGSSGSGTTLFGSTNNAVGRGPASVSTVTTTVTPSVVVVTPTVTQTAPAVTATTSPTPSPTPSGSTGTSRSGTASDTSNEPTPTASRLP